MEVLQSVGSRYLEGNFHRSTGCAPTCLESRIVVARCPDTIFIKRGRAHAESLDCGAVDRAVGSMLKVANLLMPVGVVKIIKDFGAELTPPALRPVVCNEVRVVTAACYVVCKLVARRKHSVAVFAGTSKALLTLGRDLQVGVHALQPVLYVGYLRRLAHETRVDLASRTIPANTILRQPARITRKLELIVATRRCNHEVRVGAI